MDGVIDYSEIENKTLREVIGIIGKSKRLELKDVKFLDSIPSPKSFLYYTGVYIFYRNDECLSVNRPVNNNVRQQLPLGFDDKFLSWVNILIKKINKELKLTLFESCDIVLPEISLILMNFPKEFFISELYNRVIFIEQALRQYLKPKFNYTQPPYFAENLKV